MIGKSGARRWLLAFFALAPLMMFWSVTNPLFASPDETVHMVRAQGFARLDFTNPYRTDGIPISAINCLRFDSLQTADCMTLEWGNDGLEVSAPSVANYPPLFHGLVSIPHLILKGEPGLYGMRIWLSLVISALWAFAAAILSRNAMGNWPFTALILATTPMVIFTGSTINPSGITAAFTALLMAGYVGIHSAPRYSRADFAAVAVGALGIVGTRRDGLAYLTLIILVLAIFSYLEFNKSKIKISYRWRPSWNKWKYVVVLLVSLGMVPIWQTIKLLSNVMSSGQGGGIMLSTHSLLSYLRQIVGVFGWLDSPLSGELYALYLILISPLLFLTMASKKSQYRGIFISFSTLLIAVPILFNLVRYPYFQGRYLFPIWIGFIIFGGSALKSSQIPQVLTKRLSIILGVSWVGLQGLAALSNLRRYSHGSRGTWLLYKDPNWEPPFLPIKVALILLSIICLISASAIVKLLNTNEGDQGG